MIQDLDEKTVANLTTLLKISGSSDRAQALEAQKTIAAALTTPLRKGITVGSNIDGIFTATPFDPAARIEYPIDLFRPDNDGQYTAYVIPNEGSLPRREVAGDYVTVPTFDIGASIDFLIRYAKEARFDVVGRALEVLEAGVIKKKNDDGWHTILASAVDRNILVSDANAAAGQFTKRLISLSKLIMRRNAGGNSTSMNRGQLTHLYLSPEGLEDIRNWGFDEIDDVSRREIYLAGDGSISKIYGVNLVDLTELGEGQEYQDYYTTTLGASMAASDLEVAIGLDLSRNDSFVNPVREELEVHADDELFRRRRQGYFCWASMGWACLDNRSVLALSY